MLHLCRSSLQVGLLGLMSQPGEHQRAKDRVGQTHPCMKTGMVQAAWVVLAECNPISISLWLCMCSWSVTVAQLSLLFCCNNLIIASNPVRGKVAALFLTLLW